MSEKTWKVGDLCWLKSGSPRMTVIVVEDDSIHTCWIHYETGQMYTATFPAAAVEAGGGK